MPDFWVNYFDILEFIKKYKFFGCSLPFITLTLIECFDTLRKQASKQSKHECLLSQLVCIADKKKLIAYKTNHTDTNHAVNGL